MGLKEVWKEIYDMEFNFLPEKCLLSIGGSVEVAKENMRLMQLLTLLTKHYIHLEKCNGMGGTCDPTRVLIFIRIEKAIAKRRGTEQNNYGYTDKTVK